MYEINARNAPEAYVEAMWKMRVSAVQEASRVGPVMTMPGPTLLTITNPMERVLFDPVRNANPFFHVMEFIWMMAGRNDLGWIEQFNSRFKEFADPGTSHLHAAYGNRWLKHFINEKTGPVDQIHQVIQMLRKDRTTRRAVLGMWDPSVDMDPHNDLPCNTQIYFRVLDGALNMMVLNRSNDLVWGMLGANVVHMTFLHELIASGADIPLGKYQVFTNNLHMYKDRPDFKAAWSTIQVHDEYRTVEPWMLLQPDESHIDFLMDCENFCNGSFYGLKTRWMYEVALPIYNAYMERKNKEGDGMTHVKNILAEDWRLACEQWIKRKDKGN